MHPEFRRWSRQAAVEHDEERLMRRWAAVEQVRAEWQQSHAHDLLGALDLVRLAVGLPMQDGVALESLLKPLEGGAYERRIDVSLVLLSLLEDRRNGVVGVGVAYGLGCASFVASTQLAVAQLLTHARSRLSDDAVRLRRRGVPAQLQLPRVELGKPPAIEFTELSIRNNNSDRLTPLHVPTKDSLGTAVFATYKVLQAQQAHLNQVSQQLLSYAQELHAAQRLPEERIDLLTWEHSGYSLSRMKPLGELTLAERILPAARELADQTQILPGPYAAPALLHQFLGLPAPKEVLTLAAALSAQTPEWARALLPPSFPPGLCPVLELMRRHYQDPPESGASSTPPHTLEQPVHPTRLALQLYEELLLARLAQGGQQ